jgi:hypothetical protein
MGVHMPDNDLQPLDGLLEMSVSKLEKRKVYLGEPASVSILETGMSTV